MELVPGRGFRFYEPHSPVIQPHFRFRPGTWLALVTSTCSRFAGRRPLLPPYWWRRVRSHTLMTAMGPLWLHVVDLPGRSVFTGSILRWFEPLLQALGPGEQGLWVTPREPRGLFIEQTGTAAA